MLLAEHGASAKAHRPRHVWPAGRSGTRRSSSPTSFGFRPSLLHDDRRVVVIPCTGPRSPTAPVFYPGHAYARDSEQPQILRGHSAPPFDKYAVGKSPSLRRCADRNQPAHARTESRPCVAITVRFERKQLVKKKRSSAEPLSGIGNFRVSGSRLQGAAHGCVCREGAAMDTSPQAIDAAASRPTTRTG